MLADDVDFTKAWTLLDIAAAAEIEISHAPRSPLEASLSPAGEFAWYLVRTAPGDERRAQRWLERRRFGTFLAMQRRRNLSGVPLVGGGLELMFPCWLLVCHRMTPAEKDKILATPGVAGLLRHTDEFEPGQPAIIDGGFVEQLRAMAEHEAQLACEARPGHTTARGRRHAGRLHKHKRKELHRLSEEAKSKGIFSKSEWESVTALAAHERIALLHRSLAAPSQVHQSSGVSG